MIGIPWFNFAKITSTVSAVFNVKLKYIDSILQGADGRPGSPGRRGSRGPKVVGEYSNYRPRLERVSFECRKTKTRVITLANQKGRRQSGKPIKTWSNYT